MYKEQLTVKKKVLIANGHLNVGGVEKSLVNLLQAIDYNHYSVDLLLFEGLGDYREQIPDCVHVIDWNLTETYGSLIQVLKRALMNKDVRLAFIKIVLTLSGKVSLDFLRILKYLDVTSEQYDYAIAYRVGMSADYITYIANAKKKSIWWHHGEFTYSRAMVSRWTKEFRIVDQIICVSSFTKKLIEPIFPFISSKIRVIPNMICVEELQRQSVSYNPYISDKGKVVLVSVGRLSPEKHMIDCVTIAKMLKMDGLVFTWYIVGDGSEKTLIEERIRKLQVDDCVVTTGKQSNPYPYIRYADLFVHPSYVESQGMVVLEAMALGKLCVVVSSGGTDEFVEDNKNAIRAGQSIESLYEKVSYAINHLQELDFTIDEECTVQNYTPEQIIDKLFD